MSYQLNESVHNTQWVTGHFHLIFGGAIVIMYFMIAYDLWPQLTQCAPLPQGLVKTQLWLWFVGMLVLSMPWHLVGLLGMPRRMAYYDYTDAALHPQAWTVVASTFGGALLVVSAFMFVYVHARERRAAAAVPPFTGLTVHPVNGHLRCSTRPGGDDDGLMIVNYGPDRAARCCRTRRCPRSASGP
jgi:cytochrome c oxidase subunit 1